MAEVEISKYRNIENGRGLNQSKCAIKVAYAASCIYQKFKTHSLHMLPGSLTPLLPYADLPCGNTNHASEIHFFNLPSPSTISNPNATSEMGRSICSHELTTANQLAAHWVLIGNMSCTFSMGCRSDKKSMRRGGGELRHSEESIEATFHDASLQRGMQLTKIRKSSRLTQQCNQQCNINAFESRWVSNQDSDYRRIMLTCSVIMTLLVNTSGGLMHWRLD